MAFQHGIRYSWLPDCCIPCLLTVTRPAEIFNSEAYSCTHAISTKLVAHSQVGRVHISLNKVTCTCPGEAPQARGGGGDIVPMSAHTLSVGTGIDCRAQAKQTKQNTTIIAWCLEVLTQFQVMGHLELLLHLSSNHIQPLPMVSLKNAWEDIPKQGSPFHHSPCDQRWWDLPSHPGT